MSHAVAADGTQGGVAGDDLTIAGGGGVALIGGHHIGGEEAAQEHLVLHTRTQVAVHQLPTRDVDTRACGRQTQRDREGRYE